MRRKVKSQHQPKYIHHVHQMAAHGLLLMDGRRGLRVVEHVLCTVSLQSNNVFYLVRQWLIPLDAL